MAARNKNWESLVAFILIILSGLKALIGGHFQHFFTPAFAASGGAAIRLGGFWFSARNSLASLLAEAEN